MGIVLNEAMSMPRSARISCTHFGERPMPVHVSSGFCGLRYFAGIFRRRRAGRSGTSQLGEDITHLVAFRGYPPFELGAQLLAPALFPRCHFGLNLADQLGELIDVESLEVDLFHFVCSCQ